MSLDTPVGFFIFNRPDLTEIVFEETLSKSNAAFYGGIYKINQKCFKIRSHMDAMVRKHVRRHS
jgi:hypothetical protein